MGKSDPNGSGSNCYMEFRMPSAAANAYLVAAGIVAAGMDGVQQSMQLPEQRMSKEKGAISLPTNLSDALSALKSDEYMASKLGPDFVRWFCGVKQGEMDSIDASVKEGGMTDEALSAAWQDMYMEFI